MLASTIRVRMQAATCMSVVLLCGCSFDSSGLGSAGPDGQTDSTDATQISDTASETGVPCPTGSLGCECFDLDACLDDLECVDGICVDVEAETGACTSLGCACVDDEDCDDGLSCPAGECVLVQCGDGIVDGSEDCDDGNAVAGDGCDNDCTHTEIIELALGTMHSCALIEGGRIRCWGHNFAGSTGLGSSDTIGDDEFPSAVDDLPLPPAVDIAARAVHTCAVFEDGDVRCWGLNASGQLGYGNINPIGWVEPLDGLASVGLDAAAQSIGTGIGHTCVRLTNGAVRCWGLGSDGQLGLGNVLNLGDDELPLSSPAVMLGDQVDSLAVGGSHACARLTSGGVRCWGLNDQGQLGTGEPADVGDDELPADVPELELIPLGVPMDTEVTALALGLDFSCALLSTNHVVCWGNNNDGQLGQDVGDISWGSQPGQTPSMLFPIDLGGRVVQLAAGHQHACALFDDRSVRCWGTGMSGQLGYGDTDSVGLLEAPSSRPTVDIGTPVRSIAAGGHHTCAVRLDHEVVCWGQNAGGQLGYGHTLIIGDDEHPADAGVVDLL